MLRKSVAVLVSSAWLLTGTAAIASAATQAATQPQVPATQTGTSTKNEPPLPPAGAVDIKKAQGGEFSDLGFGVILISWLAAGGLLFLIFAGDDDDDNGGPTGTFPF
jgi:hypothetical protein